MRISAKIVPIIALVALALPAMAQSDAPARKVWMFWSPKPDKLPPYENGNRPIWRLKDVLALHKGQKSWSQDIVQTHRYSARMIQMAPGEKTRTQLYPDDRTVWVVWGGQIKFTIGDEKPFIATKGFLVDAPTRVPYSLETVGNEPSLRFEVTHAGRLPLYPAGNGEPQPPAKNGMHYVKVSSPSVPDVFTPQNRMVVDFFKDVVAAHPNEPPKQPLFVNDPDNLVDMIRGKGIPLPPASNLGHFHNGNDEFWFILEGKIDYQIEDVGVITADPGDVVFVPPGRWHRAGWHDGGMDTRLSFNVRPNLMHNYGPDANGKQ
jgi:mannose-6-phosphate isomerase-like protein (cupin superfamily)